MQPPYKICVLGLWHLGEIYSACLADIGHAVVGISDDRNVIEGLKASMPPLSEPQLADLLARHQSSGLLAYTSDLAAISEADIVWFAFDIPVDDEDEVDLFPFWSALESAIPYLKDGVTIAVSSQIPVGTSRKVQERIRNARPDIAFNYFYSPENLRLGEGVKSFMDPKRVVVGADDAMSLEIARDIFAPLKAAVVEMNTASAEMAKHAINAWLATSISFTNDLADACEHSGADVEDVIRALKAEPRIGEKAYLFAGLGFSGGTLGRDLKALMAMTKYNEIDLPLITSVYKKNYTRSILVHNRLKKHFGEIKGKRFAIFGVTYKPGTSTLRRSLPLYIERYLREQGAITRLSDPLALPDEVKEHTSSFFSRDPYEAAFEADAILVLSPDPSLRELDFARLASAMKSPILFDAQNILIQKEPHIRKAGIAYWSIGRRTAAD